MQERKIKLLENMLLHGSPGERAAAANLLRLHRRQTPTEIPPTEIPATGIPAIERPRRQQIRRQYHSPTQADRDAGRKAYDEMLEQQQSRMERPIRYAERGQPMQPRDVVPASANCATFAVIGAAIIIAIFAIFAI